jgi:site-specific DNA-methyltransferase (adenine-specific)
VILDEGVARLLDSQSGKRKGGGRVPAGKRNANVYGEFVETLGFPARNDIGGASRFFYCPKASKKEKNVGLNSFALRPSYMVANGSKTAATNGKRHDRTTRHQNPHPCVKPLQLTKWLATLIKPEGENGRLLVPFSGSGSEMIGGLQAGWNEVTGIEMTPEFVPIAHARLSHHRLELKTQATLEMAEKTQAKAGRLGGLSRSRAKRLAARCNGAKGGRPRKLVIS